MRTVPKDNKPVKIKCSHCGLEDWTELRDYQVGDRLKHYTGGGDYGFCRRCRRTDTMVVIQMPQPKQTPNKGWQETPDT